MKEKATKCPLMLQYSETGLIVPFWCGSWNCPRCAKQNAREWAIRTKAQFGNGGYFYTLTQGQNVYSVNRAYELMPIQWDTFRKILQREKKSKLNYIAFIEGQPKRRFMPHFHLICDYRVFTSGKQSLQTAFTEVAKRAGFGWCTDAQQITDKRAASYVSKYASKVAPNQPRKFRRVRTSQGFAELPEWPHDAVILQGKHETFTEYVLRVSDASDTAVDTLVDRYMQADMRYHSNERLFDKV